MLKAILESLAYLVAPRNQSATVELIMKKLRIKDTLTAEEGYQDTVRTLARKPYPTIERMRSVQRLLKAHNPRIGEVNVDDLIDNRYVRKLDESGFFVSLGFLSLSLTYPALTPPRPSLGPNRSGRPWSAPCTRTRRRRRFCRWGRSDRRSPIQGFASPGYAPGHCWFASQTSFDQTFCKAYCGAQPFAS